MRWKDLGVFTVTALVVGLTVSAGQALGFSGVGAGEVITYAAMATVLSAIRERQS